MSLETESGTLRAKALVQRPQESLLHGRLEAGRSYEPCPTEEGPGCEASQTRIRGVLIENTNRTVGYNKIYYIIYIYVYYVNDKDM